MTIKTQKSSDDGSSRPDCCCSDARGDSRDITNEGADRRERDVARAEHDE